MFPVLMKMASVVGKESWSLMPRVNLLPLGRPTSSPSLLHDSAVKPWWLFLWAHEQTTQILLSKEKENRNIYVWCSECFEKRFQHVYDFYCRNSKLIKQNNDANMVMTRPRESMEGLQLSILTICSSLCITLCRWKWEYQPLPRLWYQPPAWEGQHPSPQPKLAGWWLEQGENN